MSSIATRHRTGLIVLVALAAVVVVAALALGGRQVERIVPTLPDVPGTPVALGLAAIAGAIVLVSAIVRGAASARARARHRALESVHAGAVSCGIRNRDLVARLEELTRPGSRTPSLPGRFSIVADDHGISFWAGGRRPRRAAAFPWREVRNIRADSTVAGSTSVPVAVVRIRRDGSSIELPMMLSDPRPGRYALTDAPFFATVRAWKARHRAALASEGLELPPVTGAIPIIRQARPAA
ncbi:hypothetical protein GCM10017608_02080 [Agromyces luteolus]|uniref:Uncharacterized protein n=1 Tax=Agromyces luteolus TaxID=88373 RepID=A0A7C9LD96_9MICO|nr:hypothetical protein [Agromyces luteolus]MUN05730.1 hypothetical protein [Agromyces luteolus]GLK26276.1 hypothetical protein GCM10017608_02080 [Agromyces luteolus]